MTTLKAFLPKEREHEDTCSSRPEWYSLETNGSCDCGTPAFNEAIQECGKVSIQLDVGKVKEIIDDICISEGEDGMCMLNMHETMDKLAQTLNDNLEQIIKKEE